MNPSLIDFYNQEYTKFTPNRLIEDRGSITSYCQENTKTLRTFFENYKEQSQKFHNNFYSLELGCGLGYLSQYLVDKGAYASAMDVSALAINTAKEFSELENKNIDFKVADLSKPVLFNQKFDLIIDSHLLHCLTSNDDRKQFLSNIKNALESDGTVLFETMVYQPKMQFPVDYYLDESLTLMKSIKGESLPIRAIKSTHDVEQELLENGFKIDYLYYHNELAFNIFNEEPDYPFDYLPRTLRVAAGLII